LVLLLLLSGQLGTVGTDFLRLRSIEFHYKPSQSFAVLATEACDRATFRRAGFVAVGLPNYYGADLSRLKKGMPNVPVIGLRRPIGLLDWWGYRLRLLDIRQDHSIQAGGLVGSKA
jgi:hypothetical protein